MANTNIDRFDVDIAKWEVESVRISKPKKTDDSLFGKIYHYEGKEQPHSLSIYLYNIEVLDHKVIQHVSRPYTVLLIKVDKTTCRKFLSFDQHCIDQVKSNMSSWFTKALDVNVIEEYYTSSIQLSNKNAYVLKVKTHGSDVLLSKGHYDMVMTLRGVRFYKQRFVPEWELTSVERVENDFLNSLNTDEETFLWEEDLIEENVVPEPDIEEIKMIRANISERVKKANEIIEHKLNKYSERKDIIMHILTRLEEIPMSDVVGLDKLVEELDKFEDA